MKTKRMENKFASERIAGRPALRFINMRPGGNDTCLVAGIERSPVRRKEINDLVMRLFPGIEQVGFIDTAGPELVMAGGEFCGNGTRSTAYAALSGQPGEVAMHVSGVERSLRAGVTGDGRAYAEMPIYPEPDRIEKDGGNPQATTVYMEGITQYVVWDDPQAKLMDAGRLKEYAFGILREKGYDLNYPAAGVMFVERSEKGIEMRPVVYVRDIQTLFYETACGSGTTAVGLVLAAEGKKSVKDVPVYQPTGLPIEVSVDYDPSQDRFTYAQIAGPVETLGNGLLVESLKDPYVIERVADRRALKQAVASNRLVEAYDVFSAPPYEERFEPQEVIDIFQGYVDTGMLFTARTAEKIIGFGAAVPLGSNPELAGLAATYGIEPGSTYYMADLGVVEERRGEEIGLELVKARLRAIGEGKTALMRTSVDNIASQSLYQKLGFTQIEGMEQMVTGTRTDGSLREDKRIFFVKKL